MAALYSECLRWVVFVGVSTAFWRYLTLPVYRVVAVLSRNAERKLYALEVLRLARPDASSIPSYLPSIAAKTKPNDGHVLVTPTASASHGPTNLRQRKEKV